MKNKQSFKNLNVWNDCLELVKSTYDIGGSFPDEEQQGIVATMKKYAVEIPGGISKAMQTTDGKLKQQFFENSLNAITEIDTLLIVANKLEFISEEDLDNFTEKSDLVSTQIKGLIQRFNK